MKYFKWNARCAHFTLTKTYHAWQYDQLLGYVYNGNTIAHLSKNFIITAIIIITCDSFNFYLHKDLLPELHFPPGSRTHQHSPCHTCQSKEALTDHSLRSEVSMEVY